MNKFEVGKVYNWFEHGFDPFTVLERTAKTITVCNGTNTWRMRIRQDDKGEWVCDSCQPRYAQDMFISRPEYIINGGEYGYLMSYLRNGKVIISSENGYYSVEQATNVMNRVANILCHYGTILSKAVLKDGIICDTL